MIKRIISTGFAILTLTAAAHAELKIAVVDFSRAFHEYYKSKEVEATLVERRNGILKEMQDMQDDLSKMSDEINKLKDAVQDKTLSDAARDDKKKALDVKMQDAYNQQRKMQEYEATRKQMFDEQTQRLFKAVAEDVTKEVNDEGKRDGYSLIIDKSAVSAGSGSSVILYSQDVKDITDDVIKAVNATKPAAGSTPATPPAAASTTPAPAAPGGSTAPAAPAH